MVASAWLPWYAATGFGTPHCQSPASVQPAGAHVSKYSSKYVVQFGTAVPLHTPPVHRSPPVQVLKSLHIVPSGSGDGMQFDMLSHVPVLQSSMPSKH